MANLPVAPQQSDFNREVIFDTFKVDGQVSISVPLDARLIGIVDRDDHVEAVFVQEIDSGAYQAAMIGYQREIQALAAEAQKAGWDGTTVEELDEWMNEDHEQESNISSIDDLLNGEDDE